MKLSIGKVLIVHAVLVMAATATLIAGCTKDNMTETRYPYLSGQLNKLIQAEKEGRTEEVAQKEEIELMDGKVGVMVTSKPGQVDAAIKAVEQHGGTVIWVWPSGRLSTIVPIPSLIPLRETDCIQAVDLPAQPVLYSTGADEVAH